LSNHLTPFVVAKLLGVLSRELFQINRLRHVEACKTSLSTASDIQIRVLETVFIAPFSTAEMEVVIGSWGSLKTLWLPTRDGDIARAKKLFPCLALRTLNSQH
jgi:hypothetical protein